MLDTLSGAMIAVVAVIGFLLYRSRDMAEKAKRTMANTRSSGRSVR